MTAEDDQGRALPYKPSWIDRFTDWVEQLPVRGWVFYVGLGLTMILFQVLFLWLDGGLAQAEVLLPVMIFNAFLIAFGLALIHLLDNQAVAALESMRPVLDMTGPEFDDLRFRLSTLPSRPTLIVGLAMLAFLLLSEQLWVVPVRFAALEQLPVFAVVFQIFDKSPTLVFGPFLYHTARQLRLVHAIHSDYIRINLFNLGPLQAFSRLTATTAVGLVVGVYGWLLINPDLLADPASLVSSAVFTVLAAGVFVWPLYGAHRLMEMAKRKALHEIDLRFETVFAKFDQSLDEDDYSAVQKLNQTIASLEIRHRRIAAIPTWPWRPQTARFALGAIILPLILTILQFVAAQLLDW
jgi:hypothetical protein